MDGVMFSSRMCKDRYINLIRVPFFLLDVTTCNS
jgi:hypothetical protein